MADAAGEHGVRYGQCGPVKSVLINSNNSLFRVPMLKFDLSSKVVHFNSTYHSNVSGLTVTVKSGKWLWTGSVPTFTLKE